MTRWSWGGRAALLGGAALVAVVGTASTVPVVFDVREPLPVHNVPVDLVAYDTCDAALAELRAAMAPHVGPYGLAGSGGVTTFEADGRAVVPKAAPADAQVVPEHSGTNVQEAGVDEPDLVKTDGKRVVTVVDGKLRVVDAASRKLTGTLELPAGFATHLLLRGDRALVVSGSNAVGDIAFAPGSFAPEGLTLTLVELADAPKVAGSLKLDARYLDARQVGDVVRVVVQSGPRLPWVYPADGRTEAESLQRNQEIVATAPIGSWLPGYELTAADGSRTTGPLVACDRIRHPEQHSATSMLSVLTFDFPGELGTGDAVSIVADGDTVYSTDKSLYVADDHHLVPDQNRMPAPPTTTAIHQFDLTRPGPPTHVASGQVTGSPLNRFSLSEHDGRLRVATTAFTAPGIPEQPPASQSAVTVLQRVDNRLVEVGKLDGLGVGERIYSVRFVGPLGYVVTFRQTDPLYALDLSDPAHPRKVGELKINGYSAYLHPAGDGKLIGVGQDATDEGRTKGTQVSLFDVGNAAAPTRLASHQVPGGSSEVEYDPHAFLYWPKRDLLVLPVTTYPAVDKPSDVVSGGVLVLRLRDNNFTSLGTVRHTSGPAYDPGVRRALVVGDDLWTVSAAGLQVTRIDGLAQQAWIAFT